MRSLCRPQPLHGFTLIELLVVISISALLVALLLPALNAARTTAKMTQSLSNSRQIMIALHTYANDNDSSLPWSTFYDVDDNPATDRGADGPFWGTKLWQGKYVQDWHVFWSPDHIPDGNGEDGDPDNAPAFRWSGYGANTWGPMPDSGERGRDTGAGSLIPWRLGQIGGADPSLGRPGDTLGFVETSSQNFLEGTDPAPRRDWSGAYAVSPGGSFLFTYNGNVAQGYLDGHAEGGSSEPLGWIAETQRFGAWKTSPIYSSVSRQTAMAPWFLRRNKIWNLEF